MFKTATAKGAATRDHLLEVALALFRERGFDETTMRDIAARAGLSLGAAYHYFSNKEAIVLAYYAAVQAHHLELVRRRFAETEQFRERLAIVLHTKLDVLAGDRRLLGALLRFTGDPKHPLSFLGKGTRPIQLASIGAFNEAMGDVAMPADVRHIAPTVLWAMHMGILLYFLYDESPNQARTRRLVDGATDIAVRLIGTLRFPLFKPIRTRLTALLEDAGLVLDPEKSHED
jgi:AcrR family transcriptional regulator